MKKNTGILFTTLRHNIGVESDIELARSELQAITKSAKEEILDVSNASTLNELLKKYSADISCINLLNQHLRDTGTIAFIVFNVEISRLEKVISHLAFSQEIAFISKKAPDSSLLLKSLSRTQKENSYFITRALALSALLDYSTKLVFNRETGDSVETGLRNIVSYLLDNEKLPKNSQKKIKDALNAKKTTLYLTHELHLYKGKFFPRMVRSLMNQYLEKENSLVVDPFIGSGTTILEAALMGFSSIGIDVDPTSVLISQCKLEPSSIDLEQISTVAENIKNSANSLKENIDLFNQEEKYSLQEWEKFLISAPEPMRSRLIKRGKEEGYDLLGEIENDSAKVLCLISQSPENLQPLLRVCLSHALTKKLRLRFVGIGNGRFTIDVAKVGIFDLFIKKAFHLVAITETFSWLRSINVIPKEGQVIRGSAKDFNKYLDHKKADLILTSPPYIPASSGREHYARARAIPLIFTKAATLEELDTLDKNFIGEMSATLDTFHLEEGMPSTIRETLKFLRTDAQRAPKYLPTLNYYVDLRKVLIQTKESLAIDGKALFVVGSTHTFYIHKTKEILHTLDASKAISELGEDIGLEVEKIINIPLKKSGGLNARPRSTDEYSESVVVFCLPRD